MSTYQQFTLNSKKPDTTSTFSLSPPPLKDTHEVFNKTGQYFDSQEKFEEAFHKNQYGTATQEFVEDFLENNELQEPFAFYIISFFDEGILKPDYDFSPEVEKVYELVKKQASKDTIEILHSDHGYPRYKAGMDKEIMWSHDMVMTEDNIRCPPF